MKKILILTTLALVFSACTNTNQFDKLFDENPWTKINNIKAIQ